jgi:uncharacterized protein (DUF433 family)
MGIADNPSWVKAIDDGIAAMRLAHSERGWYDSQDLINWLNEHSKEMLSEIIDSYRLKFAVWQIPSNTAAGNADGLPNGPSARRKSNEPRIEAGLIYDRGRGPEIRGTRITVFTLLPYLLDPTATEEYICRVNQLTPEQVSSARAYILNNPDTVLSQHLRIEERMAAGNSPQVREKASQSRATFLRFKEWLAQREKEVSQTQEARATEDGAGNRSGSFPTFREWIAQEESRPAQRS